MSKTGRSIEAFGERKRFKKVITSVLVASGLGGAALVLPPTHQHATIAAEERPAGDDLTDVAAVLPHVPAPVPAPAPAPVVVSKYSNAQDIVKAIVSQGQAARLSEDQIKTVIATAKIESSFRPTASGGVQAYGGPGGAGDEVIGLFQEKASFGSLPDRQDPNKSIARFIARFTEAFKKYGTGSDAVLAATLAQNPQLFRYGSRGVGTHYYNTIKGAMNAAADLYSQSIGTALQAT